MEFNDVKTIAVIGAGNMGHGIALTLGLAGYQVHLNSNTELSLQRGMDFIEADLDRLVALEMEEPARAQAALTKISTTTSLEEASRDSDVVYENLDLNSRSSETWTRSVRIGRSWQAALQRSFPAVLPR
jgi:enoyl-CoA hydratase/3-hydroxyacyl-CoA dehydrogenase